MVVLVIGSFVIGGCGMVNGKENTVPATVNSHYINEENVIHAYPDDRKSEHLSESIGLYLQYLLQVKDEENFAKQAAVLKEGFLVEKDGQVFIRWRLYEESNVNALIDDMRIAAVLKKAGEQFGEPDYLKLAERITSTVEERQHQQGVAADYYDWEYGLAGNRLTLSYLTSDMTVFTESFDMLETGYDELFFPEYYDFNENQYIKNEEVHMVDQLLIAANRYDQGMRSIKFDDWLIKEWNENGRIAGRYNRESGGPTVDYESLAVYYYLWRYFERIGQEEFSLQAAQRAELLAGDELPGELHFFDFIHYQMMMAEQ